MSKESLVQRMLTSEARIDAQRLRKGMLRDDDFPRLARAAGILSSAPVWIDDTPGITLLEMRSKARRLKAESDIGLVIVDYLQLMQGPSNSESRQQEVSQISRGLKALAKELNVPVVALSQLSRAPEQRTGDNKRPQLSDLRESGAIEQDADLIMFLYRPGVLRRTGRQGRQLARRKGRGHRRQAAQWADRQRESVLPQAVHAVRELHAAVVAPGSRSGSSTGEFVDSAASSPGVSFCDGENEDRLSLHRMRRRTLEVAGPLRHLRRVEHARRGDRRAASSPRPARCVAPDRRARDRSPRAGTSRSRRELRDVHGSSASAGRPASTSSTSCSAAASSRDR